MVDWAFVGGDHGRDRFECDASCRMTCLIRVVLATGQGGAQCPTAGSQCLASKEIRSLVYI
jgi:hypothetical protein